VHLDTIKVSYLPTDAQYSGFKRILKFTLKQLLHVSVQSQSSGSALFELAKVLLWLQMQPQHRTNHNSIAHQTVNKDFDI
jgi:hypothetical protein